MTGKTRDLRTIHIFTEKFTEGEWHWFRVIKELQIPGDETYYLLESVSGNRLLLPANYYHNYGIKPGNILHCRIDKINCSGKIFLEPEHPYYKVGKHYEFIVFDKFKKAERKGRTIEYLRLIGANDESLTAICNEELPNHFPVTIMAKLSRIKKGVLIINELEVFNSC